MQIRFGFPGVVASVSSRSDGNMSFIYGSTQEALENRQHFLSQQGIAYQALICAKQVHGNSVYCATRKDKGRGALTYETAVGDTDSFISNEHEVALAIFTADCLSVFLYDPVHSAIGLVHAGWRSTYAKVLACTVQGMKEAFGTHQSDLQAGFGPCIRSCCYEVGYDMRDKFPDSVIEKGGKLFLDLALANRRQLIATGLKETAVDDCGVCTSCSSSDFFSFRKEAEKAGRILSVMMLC